MHRKLLYVNFKLVHVNFKCLEIDVYVNYKWYQFLLQKYSNPTPLQSTGDRFQVCSEPMTGTRPQNITALNHCESKQIKARISGIT